MPDVEKKLCAVHERSSHRHRFRFDFSFILSAKHLKLFRLSRIMKNVYEIKMKRTAIKSSTWTRARQLTSTNSFESHTHICIYLIWSLCTYTIPFKNTAHSTPFTFWCRSKLKETKSTYNNNERKKDFYCCHTMCACRGSTWSYWCWQKQRASICHPKTKQQSDFKLSTRAQDKNDYIKHGSLMNEKIVCKRKNDIQICCYWFRSR